MYIPYIRFSKQLSRQILSKTLRADFYAAILTLELDGTKSSKDSGVHETRLNYAHYLKQINTKCREDCRYLYQ